MLLRVGVWLLLPQSFESPFMSPRFHLFSQWFATLTSAFFWAVFGVFQGFSEERFAFEKAEMGLPVRVTLYAPDEKTAIPNSRVSRIPAVRVGLLP